MACVVETAELLPLQGQSVSSLPAANVGNALPARNWLKVTSLSRRSLRPTDWLVPGPNPLPQFATMLKGHPAPEIPIQSAEVTALTVLQLNQLCFLTSLAFLTSKHVYISETLTNTTSPGNSWSQSLIPEIPITSSPSKHFFFNSIPVPSTVAYT